MITDKLLLALHNDDMNSPLITVLNEIFNSGYQIKLEGIEINKDDLDHPSILDLELYSNEISLELLKNNRPFNKIKMTYSDYHKVQISEEN